MLRIFAILSFGLAAHFLSAQYGTLDPTFGDGGLVRTRYEPGYVTAYDVAIQPDSKILVTGQIYDSVSHLAVFRYLPDGNLDVPFGDSGIAILPHSANCSFGYRLKLQPDGKIVVAGPANLGGYWDIAVARFLPTGKPDLAFGNGGIATLDISGQQDHLLGMALQPDGKVLVVGMTTKINTAFTLGMFVARFRSDGTLDKTFADNGVFTRSNPSFFDAANCVSVLADGNILIGGSHWLTTMSGSDYMFPPCLVLSPSRHAHRLCPIIYLCRQEYLPDFMYPGNLQQRYTALHFTTATVRGWNHLLHPDKYKHIIADSLDCPHHCSPMPSCHKRWSTSIEILCRLEVGCYA